MINKFQKRGLGILRDIPQIDPLRIPDQVELTDFTGVDFDFVQNCANGRTRSRCISRLSAGSSYARSKGCVNILTQRRRGGRAMHMQSLASL